MNCLVCNTTYNLLPQQLDSQIWTSLLQLFEDCHSVIIPHDWAKDQGLTFCHECILNLELWKSNRDKEIKCSARARQAKARMAAKILSLPSDSEDDLVMDQPKKNCSSVVDQVRKQVRKQYNATVRLVKMEDCCVKKTDKTRREMIVKHEEIPRLPEPELENDFHEWLLSTENTHGCNAEMETESSTTLRSSSSDINSTTRQFGHGEVEEPLNDLNDEATATAQMLQGLLDKAADLLNQHDLLLKAWTARSKNSSLNCVPSPEGSETLTAQPEIPDFSYISPLLDLLSNSAGLTNSPYIQGSASSNHVASGTEADHRKTILIAKIGPDVYKFGDFPVQLVNGKYICLTCAAMFGGKSGQRSMRQHVRSVHISFSSSKHLVNEIGHGKYLYKNKVPFSEKQDGTLWCGRCDFRGRKSEWKFFSAHLKYQHFLDPVRSKVQPLKNRRVGKARSNYFYGIRVIADGSEDYKCGECSQRFHGKAAKWNCRRHVFGIHLGLLNWPKTVTKLGEGKFCYMNKIPFTFKNAGFQCEICPAKTSGHHEAILTHMAMEHAEIIRSDVRFDGGEDSRALGGPKRVKQ